jgi:uncharacterized OB-fold protein
MELSAPTQLPGSEPFWQACEEGRLMLGHCQDCSQAHWYPRSHCPHCGSQRTELRQCAGSGTIYSVSVTRKAGPTPFAIAYVTVDEGVTLLTQIVDCDLDALRIGQRVQLVFKPTTGGPPVWCFVPVLA